MKKMEFPNGSSINFSDSIYGLPYYESLGDYTWLGIERESMNGLGGPMQTRPYDEVEGGNRQVSIRKEIELEIAQYEKILANKREMLELLDRNKDIERFMDLSRGTAL